MAAIARRAPGPATPVCPVRSGSVSRSPVPVYPFWGRVLLLKQTIIIIILNSLLEDLGVVTILISTLPSLAVCSPRCHYHSYTLVLFPVNNCVFLRFDCDSCASSQDHVQSSVLEFSHLSLVTVCNIVHPGFELEPTSVGPILVPKEVPCPLEFGVSIQVL